MVFNVGQATVSRDTLYLEQVVRERIPIPAKMHAVANRVQSIEDLEARIPGLAVLVYISEQPIYRPQDDETQKTLPKQGQATHQEDPVRHHLRLYNTPDVDSRRGKQA